MPEPIPMPPPPPPAMYPTNATCCKYVVLSERAVPRRYVQGEGDQSAVRPVRTRAVRAVVPRRTAAVSAAPRLTTGMDRSPLCKIHGRLRPDFDTATCDAINGQLRDGCFSFKPVERMTLAIPATVNAALAEKGNCASARLRVGETDAIRTAEVKISTFTFAKLTSTEPSMKIVAKSDELVNLARTPEPLWTWEVTPTKETIGDQTFVLTLETGV